MTHMTRHFLLASILSVAVACGGGSKKDDTAPGVGGGGGGGGGMAGDGVRPEDVDPEGPIPEGSGGGDDGSGDVVAVGGGGDDNEPDEPAAPPPKIEPPGLDKSPGEIQVAVRDYLRTAKAALKKRRWDAAIDASRKALNEDEVNVAAMITLAHGYYGKGYHDKTEAILDIAAKRPDGPSHAKLYALYGLTYDKTNRNDKAMAAYEKCVDVQPNYKSCLINVGAKYIGKGRYSDSVRIYEKLTGELGYTSAKAWSNLGAAYRGRSADLNSDRPKRTQFLKKAETAFKRAVTANNKYGGAYYNLGLLYLDADPFPRADGQDMDTLKRLERAKTYFNEYRGMPGANQDKVDEQITVAEKLHAREVKLREKRKEREAKKKKREAKRLERERKEKEREANEGGNE